MSAAPPLRIDRKISLSDAVIGIAATLLILDVKAPVGHSFSEEGMLAFLMKVGDQLIACLVTFVLIGAYWMQHRRIVDHFVRSSAMVAWLNLGFLFLISLTPFSAALVNAYPDEAAAIVVFGGIHLLCGLSLTLVWTAARVEAITRCDRTAWRRVLGETLVTPCVCLLAVAAAQRSPSAGLWFFLTIPAWLMLYSASTRSVCSPKPTPCGAEAS